MACGDGEITRDHLSSPPADKSPLKEIAVKLPKDSSGDRLKADVWATAHGQFKEKPGVEEERNFPGVNSGEVKGKRGRWDFKPDKNVEYVPGKVRPYVHLTGRAGWLGPESLLSRLPADAQKEIKGRRFIVLGKDPGQTWVNERNTTENSEGKQTTVVHPALVRFKKR